MNEAITICLPEIYEQFDTPVDRLLVDPKLREEFAKVVRDRTGHNDIATDQVMRRLLALRKAGGLPRLRR